MEMNHNKDKGIDEKGEKPFSAFSIFPNDEREKVPFCNLGVSNIKDEKPYNISGQALVFLMPDEKSIFIHTADLIKFLESLKGNRVNPTKEQLDKMYPPEKYKYSIEFKGYFSRNFFK